MGNEQIDYLYAGISDTQSLINFIDTKTAGGITIIGLFLASIFSMLDDLLKFANWYSWLHWLLLGITLFALFLCIVVVARILKPTINPRHNIQKKAEPALKFFLARNNYDFGKMGNFIYPYYNSNHFKLTDKLEDYSIALLKANKEDIAESLSYELLKLSFIRNIKNDRFHFLFRLLIITTVVFLSFIFCHTKELIAIKALVACGCIN